MFPMLKRPTESKVPTEVLPLEASTGKGSAEVNRPLTESPIRKCASPERLKAADGEKSKSLSRAQMIEGAEDSASLSKKTKKKAAERVSKNESGSKKTATKVSVSGLPGSPKKTRSTTNGEKSESPCEEQSINGAGGPLPSPAKMKKEKVVGSLKVYGKDEAKSSHSQSDSHGSQKTTKAANKNPGGGQTVNGAGDSLSSPKKMKKKRNEPTTSKPEKET
jgi:hypothetical protein